MMIKARRDPDGKYVEVDGEVVPSDYRQPDWATYDKQSKHIHEWKYYLSDAMRLLWPTLNEEQQAAIAANAQSHADREHWD
jgi:hypothetical protein